MPIDGRQGARRCLRLRDHARLDRSGRSAIDLNSLVRAATLELAGPEARRRQVRLDFQPEGVPEVVSRRDAGEA